MAARVSVSDPPSGFAAHTPRRRPPRLRWLLAAVLAGPFCTVALAAAEPVVIRNPTIAGGGAVLEAGEFRLIATLGEPVMGTTAAADLRLTAGFPATLGDPLPTEGDIFKDSFESN